MSQTISKIQVYDLVPALKPNVGKSSYRDATPAELKDQVYSAEMKRQSVVTTYDSNAVPSPLDTQLSKIFIINMISNIGSLLLNDGVYDGQPLILILKQDATGGRTLGYNATKTQGGLDVGVPVLNGTANSRDYHCMLWNALNLKWDFMPNLRRYP